MEKESKQRKMTTNMFIISLTLTLIAIVLFIVFNLKGEEKTSGDFVDIESAVSVTCEAEGVDYPLFDSSGATEKRITTKMVADGATIHDISLVNELYFGSEEAVIESRDRNHFSLNKSFEIDVLEPDEYDAMYSTFDDHYKVSLFASSGDINNKALKYFMLDELDKSDDGYSYSDAIDIYEKYGFKCKENK